MTNDDMKAKARRLALEYALDSISKPAAEAIEAALVAAFNAGVEAARVRVLSEAMNPDQRRPLAMAIEGLKLPGAP